MFAKLPFYTTKKMPTVRATVTKCASLTAIARYFTIIYTIGYWLCADFPSRLLFKEALQWFLTKP